MWKCTLLWTKMIVKSPATLNRQFTWISNLFHLLLAANKRIRQQFFSTSQRSWLSSGVLLMQSLCSSCFPLLDQTCIPSVWPLEPKLSVLVKPCLGWNHEKAWHNGWPPMVTTGYFCHCNFIIKSLNILNGIPKGSWNPSSGQKSQHMSVSVNSA